MTFHHFIGSGLSRSEKVQAWVIEQLLSSKLPVSKRESSVQWELKHSSGVIQLARLIAQKRGVNEELAVISAALHDIYVIMEGGYAEHAKEGEKIARNILMEQGEFAENEIDQICNAIANHSDKHIQSDDKLVELIKDADCIDCFFYGDDVYDDKPPEKLKYYYKRIVNIRQELGLPSKDHFARDTL